LRDQDDELIQLYDVFFAGKEVKVLEIDATVIEEATAVRADIGLKAPDAIHAATARLAGAAEFWTADRHFLKCPGLRVELFKAV
jgi:predicted nucleic acid-binding protein